MAERIAIEIVIEIRVGVDVDDGQIIMALTKCLKYWIGDRMVTSESDDLTGRLELGLDSKRYRCSVAVEPRSFVRTTSPRSSKWLSTSMDDSDELL